MVMSSTLCCQPVLQGALGVNTSLFAFRCVVETVLCGDSHC